jgi:hypothetical protein
LFIRASDKSLRLSNDLTKRDAFQLAVDLICVLFKMFGKQKMPMRSHHTFVSLQKIICVLDPQLRQCITARVPRPLNRHEGPSAGERRDSETGVKFGVVQTSPRGASPSQLILVWMF